MPAFSIIDTHVHFWDDSAVPISWQKGTALDRPFRPADFENDHGQVSLEAIVFVEADVDPPGHIAEADFVSNLAATNRTIKAIVAHAPMTSEHVADDLNALSHRPLVRAVRYLIQGKDAAALCASSSFRNALKLLPSYNFHFELCILHDQLKPVLSLVESLPDVSFVMDHIAKPGIKAGLREPWWSEIEALAALPNVTCKLSGVATEADHDTWNEERLRPYLDRVLEMFGPDRIMFGSDWPVMRLAIDYPRWVEIVDNALSSLSEDDRRKIYVDNARRIYRIN